MSTNHPASPTRALTLVAAVALGSLLQTERAGAQVTGPPYDTDDFFAFSAPDFDVSPDIRGLTDENTSRILHSFTLGIDETAWVNHMATDSQNDRLIFTYQRRGPGVWSPFQLQELDLTTGTVSDIFGTFTEVDFINLFTNQNGRGSSGGGAFYNGAYYMFADFATPEANRGLWRGTFDANGNLDTFNNVFSADPSDGPFNDLGLGDIAIDADGIMFLLGTDPTVTPGSRVLLSLDLNGINNGPYAGGMELVGSVANDPNQLFIDSGGRLFTQNGLGNSELREIILEPGTTTPYTINSTQVVSSNGLVNGIADFSEGGIVGSINVIPEPSGSLLMGLAFGSLLLRRRRA